MTVRRPPPTARRYDRPPLGEILKGKKADVPMEADDILFVPSSMGKKLALRSIEAAISIGTGVAVFRR